MSRYTSRLGFSLPTADQLRPPSLPRLDPPLYAASIPIGGIDFPADTVLPGNITLWGSPYSGKSLLLAMMMRALLPFHRGLVFDEKADLLPTLRGILPEERIANLHVLDGTALAWDIAHDLRSEFAWSDFAHALIPDSPSTPGSNARFFDSNARQVIEAVGAGLNARMPGDYGLCDLICASSPENIYDVLRHTERGQRVIANLLTSKATAVDRPQDLIATISSHVDQYIPIAMAMEHHRKAGRTFSLNDWVAKRTRETCVRVAHDARYEPSLNPWVGLMMRYVSRRLRGRPGTIPTPDFVFFLDEAHSLASDWQELPKFMALSRSKGVSSIVATQSLAVLRLGLRDQDAATAVLDNSRTQIFLRSDSPETARIAAELAGKQTFLRAQESWGESESDGYAENSGGGRSSSFETSSSSVHWSSGPNWTRAYNGSTTLVAQTEDLMPQWATLSLPQASPERGLSCFCRVANLLFAPTIHPEWIRRRLPKPAATSEPELDLEHVRFRRWSDEEAARFLPHSTGGFFDEIKRRRRRSP
jgi:hypothetical protein